LEIDNKVIVDLGDYQANIWA